jgi:NADPH:quinone reductase-like Zn-dependent oxidoreductase
LRHKKIVGAVGFTGSGGAGGGGDGPAGQRITRPTIVHYAAERAELEQRTNDLFAWVHDGRLRLRTEFEFPLKDARAAHEALEGRKTTGKILLIP